MRSHYRGYYGINGSELDALWSDGLVVLDTNVLLGLYPQSVSTRKAMSDALERMSANLWMPHQVGLEFHRNREGARADASAMHRQLTAKIRKDREATAKLLADLARRDPLLIVDEMLKDHETGTEALVQKINEAKTRLDADRKGPDPVLALVEDLFGDTNIGAPFTADELSRHRRLGAERVVALQPPGYADAKDKTGDRVYGDYFLWAQLLEHAAAARRDVILVTDDEKDDWRTAAGVPRPELLDEFFAHTGKLIQIYSSQEFLIEEDRRRNNTTTASEEVIRAADEIKEIFDRAADLRRHERYWLSSLSLTGDKITIPVKLRSSANAPLANALNALSDFSDPASVIDENVFGRALELADFWDTPVGRWFRAGMPEENPEQFLVPPS